VLGEAPWTNAAPPSDAVSASAEPFGGALSTNALPRKVAVVRPWTPTAMPRGVPRGVLHSVALAAVQPATTVDFTCSGTQTKD
jgi:hypothetical protein